MGPDAPAAHWVAGGGKSFSELDWVEVKTIRPGETLRASCPVRGDGEPMCRGDGGAHVLTLLIFSNSRDSLCCNQHNSRASFVTVLFSFFFFFQWGNCFIRIWSWLYIVFLFTKGPRSLTLLLSKVRLFWFWPEKWLPYQTSGHKDSKPHKCLYQMPPIPPACLVPCSRTAAVSMSRSMALIKHLPRVDCTPRNSYYLFFNLFFCSKSCDVTFLIKCSPRVDCRKPF